MRDLSEILKAYDVRGLVPEQVDESLAAQVGAAFVRVLADDVERSDRVVVGHDMRPSSPALVRAFADGVAREGLDVVLIGLAATDQLYFASGWLDCPGAMFTASHNPARYNGIKLCRSGARPVGRDTGLLRIRELIERGIAPAAARSPGTITERDVLPDYAAHLRSLVDISGIRPLTVVVDAGNGMAGHTVPAVLGVGLPVTVVPLYFELDGSFPHHEANPIDPANLRDLQTAVRTHGADLGLAFDGDADRCFVVDERGEIVDPSALTALIAVRELAKDRANGGAGTSVVHNVITSRVVPETVERHGGIPVRTRVGHSFIKAEMARTGAVFGGEHSGHFYFRDFWFADSGMLAALHTLAALGEQERPLSALVSEYSRYARSGEVNSSVADLHHATAQVRQAFEGRDGATVENLDGMTVASAEWWFNLRPSNTEPLLRLNVEARDPALMEAVRDEVLAIVRKEPA